MIHKHPAIPLHETDHHAFEELCALATSGALTGNEWKKLVDHLDRCPGCREVVGRYQEIASSGIALIAPDEPTLENDNEWSPEAAVARLMNRLREEGKAAATLAPSETLSVCSDRRFQKEGVLSLFKRALPYALAATVLVVVSASLYISGIRTGERHVNTQPQARVEFGSTLDAVLRDRMELQRHLQAQAGEMAKLSVQLEQLHAEVEEWQKLKRASDETIKSLAEKTKQQANESVAIQSQNRSLAEERLTISRKLQGAELALTAAQHKLESLHEQHESDLVRITKLESQVAMPADQKRPTEYVEARDLFPADQNLQDLMGARDLFIADVYDIDKSGLRRRPFGRVFYTSGRSLVFYAFDLDQQPGVKLASAFQVWGRRGYGNTHPVNMGMMYMESKTSERWVFKFDDAKALSQIDAVFVTIEPHGGSDAPKGRQLLYASLKTPPNHP